MKHAYSTPCLFGILMMTLCEPVLADRAVHEPVACGSSKAMPDRSATDGQAICGQPGDVPMRIAKVLLKSLPRPGRYRAGFRLKMQGVRGVGKRIRLCAFRPSEQPEMPFAKAFVFACDFDAVGRYQTFDLEFDYSGKGAVRLVVMNNPEISAGYTTNMWLSKQTSRAKYIICKNDIEKLFVDSITVEPIVTSVGIVDVRSEKVHYSTFEKPVILVTLRNYTDAEVRPRVRCELIRELDSSTNVHDATVTLQPRQDRTVSIRLKRPLEAYGRQIKTRVSLDSKPCDERVEYFGVSDSVLEIGLNYVPSNLPTYYQWPAMLSRPISRIYIDSMVGEYGNIMELGSLMPADYADLTPDTEYWYGCQGRYPSSKRAIKELVDEAHKRGVKVVIYGKAIIGGGPPFFELIRKHPEWLWYDSMGRPRGYGQKMFDVDMLNRWNEGWFEGKGHWTGWPNAMVNLKHPEAFKHGINEMIGSAEMLGIDGVRFDGHFHVYQGYDFNGKKILGPDETEDSATAKNTREMKKAVWRKRPGFLFGYNWGPQYAHRYGGSRRPKDYLECASDGGMIMNEQMRAAHIPGSSVAPNRWRNYAKLVLEDVDNLRKMGGYLYVIRPDKSHPVDHTYTSIILLAAGAHDGYGNRGVPRYGKYGQFATRYSAFIWGRGLKRIKNPKKLFSVEAPGRIWWEEFAVRRQVSNRSLQHVLHLINPPVKERIYVDPLNEIPPRLGKVKVVAKVPSAHRVAGVWLLSGEPETRSSKLPFEVKAGDVHVTVPQVTLWSIVVFDYAR